MHIRAVLIGSSIADSTGRKGILPKGLQVHIMQRKGATGLRLYFQSESILCEEKEGRECRHMTRSGK